MAKRNIVISLVLCACALPMAANSAESVSNATQTARQLFSAVKTAANKMAGLGEVAPRVPYRSALAVDAATGKVLYQDNADVKAHPASCTKMMTLLLVLEDLRAGRYALSDTVKASAYAATFRGSSLGIKAGEAITVEDLLYALMIRSANDGAVVLAEHSSLGQRASRPLPAAPESDPTEESKRLVRAFVDRMNRRAQELGMTNTRYVSPNGMTPYRNQAYPGFDTSTATDLSKLARHLVTMPEVFKYTSCPERAIAMGDRKDVSLVAHNYFLPGTTDPQKYATPVPGCDGLKTGFTDAAGASIVLTAQRDGRRVVAVVLGCANRLTRETAAACILRTALDAR
ncbi:MAG: D-alanyl-D-alanine carboxypeptidase [Kiritimatiellae bacterium]|nr:D-alanyl-D-alanine carboxypeptidase [Kiritimatiellia bacterium]